MENELMPCPVCGGGVTQPGNSDVYCVDCNYKNHVGDHNALARRAEIGRIVEALFATATEPDIHIGLINEADGGFNAIQSRYNFAEPVERMEDEGEGITYLIADPLIGEDSGSGPSLLDALRALAAEIGVVPPEFSESIAGEMGCAACKTGPYETHAPRCRLTKERVKRATRDLATTACEACGGSGDNRGGDCPKCDGTGIGGSDQ